jgi:hypothetical protein
MVYFQTKNQNLDKFWRALDWKMLIYFMAIWIFYRHSGYFMTIWYIWVHLVPFSGFGILCQEKSGNPAWTLKRSTTLRTKVLQSVVSSVCGTRAQGDQMSLLKNRPKCSPTHFFV